jgi:hypothetical protein
MQKAEGRKPVRSRRSEAGFWNARCSRRLPPFEFRLHHRGISMIVVLGLVAVTMATSYALMRSEFYAVRIQQNSNRQSLARQAAMAGISVAMQKMHQSTWAGVGTTLTGNTTSQDSYSVTFTAGDDSLSSSSSNYAEYPYRVTLVSTGASVDPNSTTSKATHKVRAVVRLIPRKLATGPSDLATIVNYTWYQTQNDTFQFQVPLHVQGKSRIQGEVDLGSDYQWSNNTSDRYLDDLDLMRQAGSPDYRPFSGPLEISFNQNNGGTRNWLTGTLGVSLISNAATGMSSQWVHPGSVQTYRLYTGGPSYSVPAAPSTVTGGLQSNPVTNPAGLFYQSSDITLGSNASILGTLVGSGVLTISGSNVTIAPVDLMPLQGTTNKVRLPSLLSADDIYVTSGGEPTIDGLVVAFDKFNLQMGSQTKVLTMHGNLVAKRFYSEGRSEFNVSSGWWSLLYSGFNSQNHGSSPSRIYYFPQYCSAFGLQTEPKVNFAPPDNPVTYLWPTDGITIYVADPTDGGLRWELVDWRDLH